jgi:hypothetical protein
VFKWKFLIGLNNDQLGIPSKLKNTLNQKVLGGFKIRPLTKIGYKPDSEEFIRNEDGTYDHEFDTVPVSLLRRYMRNVDEFCSINIVKDYAKWPFILSTIDHTIRSIENNNISFKKIMKINRNSSSTNLTYGFTLKSFKDIYDSDIDKYKIVKALLIRIEFGHRLLKFFNNIKNCRLEFASQLFIDTHLDLLIHVINNNCIEDSELLDEEIPTSLDLQCSFKRHYPHETNFAYCGDLPDLTTCIDLGNIWYDVRPRNGDLISHIIHIFASKVLKHKCSERNFIRITVDKYCEEYPIFNLIYRLLIEVSLLGNYPHAKFRTSFEQRLEIRNEFHHVMSFNNNKVLHKWMRENESMVVAISKEYHMFTVVSQYSLDVIMEETKNWKEIKLICSRAMDMIRSLTSNYRLTSMLSGTPRSAETRKTEIEEVRAKVKDRLTTLEQRMSVLLDKLKKCNFLDFMLFYIEKHFQNSIVNKKSTISIDIEDILSKEVISGIDTIAMYASVKYKSYIPTKYMKCFGMTKESYDMIRDFYFRYEMSNIPDNSVKTVLVNINNHSIEDFFILRAYFQAIRQYKFFETYPYTMSQFNAVMYSLRIKHMIPPWLPVSEEHSRYYFCIICKKWACPVVDPHTIQTVVDVFSLGKEKVSRDPESKKLYCGKQVTSIIIKNLIESRVYFLNGPIEDEGLAKAIRNHKSTYNCTTTPLTFVNLPGKIISILGKKWVVCSICTQPTIFEGAKLDTNGFTCCFHEKSTKKRKGTSGSFGIANGNDDALTQARIDIGLTQSSYSLDLCGFCGSPCNKDSVKVKIVNHEKEVSSYFISLCHSDLEAIDNDIDESSIYIKSALFDKIAIARAKNTGVYKGRKFSVRRTK